MKKKKEYIRWMQKSGDYLLCIAHTKDEVKRVRCQIKCSNEMSEKGDPKQKLVKVRITEL